MSRTRWKLMIGALGVGLGGLAAIADTPTKPGVSCAPPTTHTAMRIPAEPPLTLPPLPDAPVPSALPVVEPPALPTATKPLPMMPPAKDEAKLPALPPLAKDEPKPVPLPMPPSPERIPVPELSQPLKITFGKPSPPAEKPSSKMDNLLGVGVPAPPMPELPRKAEKLALPAAVVVVAEVPAMPPAPKPAMTEVKPVAVAVTPVAAEKKLTVVLHMGDQRPKFEVRDGEVVYLRVMSEKVDVKSPPDSVEANLSTMRATGKVRFVTPGGEGTCDELSVVPGTGQVTVTGHVAFTYSWGKVETTVTGDKMTFRLGDAPGQSR